jgi:flagellar biosynthesis/type III secretory pathway protein FliH
MPIDPVGKAPPLAPAQGTEATLGTGAEFSVGKSEGAAETDLARLERGEIGLEAYLDARVEEATRHLASRLSPAQLDFVKQTLRTELESDPVLIELVRRATGKSPASAAP